MIVWLCPAGAILPQTLQVLLEALARQEALPQAKKVIALLPEVLAEAPEATIYHISSSEPWG